VKKASIRFLHVLFFLMLFKCAFPQAYQFKNYGVDNGITQPYVYTINQDKNGYLFIGTGEGIFKYDGVAFKPYVKEDGLSENFVTASYQDNARNLWLGHYEGSVTYYDGKKFKSINTSKFSKSPIYSIAEDDKGFVWFATQNDGVFRINKDFEVEAFKVEFVDQNIFSLNFSKNDELLVGTSNGLLIYKLNGKDRKPVLLKNTNSIPETKIQCIIKKNNSGSFWVGTEDQGLFLLTPSADSKFTSTPIAKNLVAEIANVQDVYEDAQSNLWIATFGNGVVKLLLSPNTLVYSEYQRLSEDNGLGNKYTKTIYCDHEGNMWIGTYGTGLVELIDNLFTSYFHSSSDESHNVTALSISDHTKWFGLEKGLLKIHLNGTKKKELYTAKNGFTDDRVTALVQVDSNHLIIGTDHSGAFRVDIRKNKFEKISLTNDILSNSINAIAGNERVIWIATKNGVFKLDQEAKLVKQYNTETGLTHNNINHIFLDKTNILWVATHSNFISSISENGTLKNTKVYNGSDLINITGVLKDQQNNLWLITMGNGVFRMDKKDSVTIFNSANNDLKSNYCYSIIDDGANNIWVGHRMGLSRIKGDAVKTYGKEEGITGDCNFSSFFKDANGNAWFGTTDDAIMFDPHKDKKNLTAPIINITSLKMNDKYIDASKNIDLPYDEYKLRIDFIGVSFKANSRITYQYKLDGYDAEWSDKTYSNYAQYGKLVEGEYTFLLRAYNSDGVSNTVPLTVHIKIAPPVWKSPWFIILVIAGIIYGFYLIVKIRESNHRRFQAQLQKALNEKTREVIIQKEEIEKKNKDITDSIRYAKRIQDALLPDLEKLKEIFPLSFVFFQPRDIVSGDFYWFEKYDNRLIIVCADATGHGVPGAFMSMIGTTLLKDITSRPDITSPAQTLDVLDKEIKNLLRQNDDEQDHTHDTVDIIICEIDLETYFMRMCSTRRSMFISINNELTTFKKEKENSDSDLLYENRSIQLQKGDTLYMFTDGYPDQFGGEKSKKIKISNMKLMLEQIQTLPMSQQAMIVDRYFNRWKEGHEQVDDVLFIGIKL
jgi:ligand-binding sensor domain-containing protein